MGNSEYGMCDICKEETHLTRTVFRYDIRCTCHSPYHFVMYRHCNKCTPKEPEQLIIPTKYLKKII
jgi:hypothetical protein